jgi:hypothetical protein
LKASASIDKPLVPAHLTRMMASSAQNIARSIPHRRLPLQPLTTRRLLTKEEIGAMLNLDENQVQFLIGTDQVRPIRIAGEVRFDSLDINRLIEAYKTTASRRIQ